MILPLTNGAAPDGHLLLVLHGANCLGGFGVHVSPSLAPLPPFLPPFPSRPLSALPPSRTVLHLQPLVLVLDVSFLPSFLTSLVVDTWQSFRQE